LLRDTAAEVARDENRTYANTAPEIKSIAKQISNAKLDLIRVLKRLH
jgi:hypothetical protein